VYIFFLRYLGIYQNSRCNGTFPRWHSLSNSSDLPIKTLSIQGTGESLL